MSENQEHDAVAPAQKGHSPFGWLVDGMNALGTLLILAMTLLICVEVAVRNITGSALPGVTEVVAFAVVMIVFLQIASTLRHQRFARADIFIGAFTQRHPMAGGIMLLVFDLLGAAVAVMLCYGSWTPLHRAWTQDLFFGITGVFTAPEWPMRAAVVLGCGLLFIQYLVHALTRIRALADVKDAS